MLSTPDYYMSLALTLAKQGRLTVSPNPMVGCVLVHPEDGRIIAEAYHQEAGKPHAEIEALRIAGDKARRAIAYVSLEPCCHHGKTPPCTEALIQAGIKQVYIPCVDPNPLVAGKGVEMLRSAGIEVNIGVAETESKKLNEIFFHYMQYQRPFVISKWAMSLDGKTITHANDSKQISSQKSHAESHEWRQIVDAILIGANTAIEDDPSLTVRNISLPVDKIKQPKRIILTTTGELPTHLKVFNDQAAPTIIATCTPLKGLLQTLAIKNHIEVIEIPREQTGKMDLLFLLNILGKKQITSLLVEGGMITHEHFFSADLVNKLQVYVAPTIIAKLNNKKILSQMHCQQLDNDYYFTADYS